MSKNQFTGTATRPQRNRKLYQFNKDQYCIIESSAVQAETTASELGLNYQL